MHHRRARAAPPSCVGFQTRLGRPLRPGELGLDGVVRVHPTPPLYRLTLRLRIGDRGERRTLGAENCSALADATAVVVALAVESSPPIPTRPRPADNVDSADDAITELDAPTTTALVPEPPVLPPVEPSTPPAPPVIDPEPAPSAPVEPRPAPAPPVEPPPRSRRPGALVRLHGGAEFGALPGVTGAVGLATGLLWRRARLELQGLYLAPRTGQNSLGDVRATLAAAGLHGCARVGRGRLEIPLCAGLELGGMRGSVDGAGSATRWWLGVVVGAGVALRITRRLGLWTALEMVGSAVKPNFVARDPKPAQSLFKPAPVTGRLLLGVELRFSDPR